MANNRKKKQRAQAARAEAKAKKARRDTFVIGGVALAFVLGIVGYAVLFAENDVGITESTAWDLPALEGDLDDDGEDDRFRLASYAGKPLIVNFFASWCVSCESELPRFRAVEDQFADQIEVVYVNSNETGNWRPMAERTGIVDRELVKDIKGAGGNGLYRSLGGTGGMPLTAFYDGSGNVVQVDRGELSTEALQVRLQQLFGIAA